MIIHCDTTRFVWEVFENGEYKFLFDKLRVIDLGCNIGTFSLWIYPHAERIWAVDKEQNHIDNFNKTIRDNELKNIETFTEKIVSLSDFMQGHSISNVDVLKIDVEGDEYEILEDPKFPANKILVIIGEYHFTEHKLLRFQDRISELGYRYIEFPNNHFVARKI